MPPLFAPRFLRREQSIAPKRARTTRTATLTPTPIPALAPVLSAPSFASFALPVAATAVDVPDVADVVADSLEAADDEEEEDIEAVEVEVDVALEVIEKVVVVVASARTENCSPPNALSLSSYFVSLKLHKVGNWTADPSPTA